MYYRKYSTISALDTPTHHTVISYYNTGIEDLIVEILEDIVIINWTPLNYTELTSYVLEYKQTNEQTFQTIVFSLSIVSTGLPILQHDIEYVFKVYGVFTINNVEYESGRSPPVTIMINSSTPSLTSSSNDSQTGSTGLVAGVSVLSIIIIILFVVIIIFMVILFRMLSKISEKQKRVLNYM